MREGHGERPSVDDQSRPNMVFTKSMKSSEIRATIKRANDNKGEVSRTFETSAFC